MSSNGKYTVTEQMFCLKWHTVTQFNIHRVQKKRPLKKKTITCTVYNTIQ